MTLNVTPQMAHIVFALCCLICLDMAYAKFKAWLKPVKVTEIDPYDTHGS